jgi:uncharacterized protein YndB with AHSA1/START domain
MPNIRQRLLIGAPPEIVYAALTTHDGLASWWTPDVAASSERGGVARFGFRPPYTKVMRIQDLRPGERVEWRCMEGADEWRDTTLLFELKGGGKDALLAAHSEMADQIEQQRDAPTMTLLTLSHDQWRASTAMFAECSYTWGQFLRGLKLYCESGSGKPWPNQHRREA